MVSGKFDEQSARRIGRVVRIVERQNTPLGYNRANSVNSSDNGFWAEITDTDDNGKYAWEKLKPAAGGTFSTDLNWGSGSVTENTAYEINESKTVLKEERVFLRPSVSEDYFVFEYNPTGKIGKASADIPALSGTTAGSGTVTIYKLDGGSLTDTGETVTAYNIASDDVTADVFLQLKYIDGEWVVDFEDCG